MPVPEPVIEMAIQGGGDTGKIIVDKVSLPHPEESKGMEQRRVRIGYRLGLILWGTKGTIQINWKSLQGRFCRVDLAYKSLGGGEFLPIMVVQIRGTQIRLGIETPPDQLVLRKEVKPDSEKKPKVTSS